MTARVTSSASDSLGAIPTAGRQGARCGDAFNRSSVVTYSAVARVSRSASTGPPRLDVGFATPILDALLHLSHLAAWGRKLPPLGIGHLVTSAPLTPGDDLAVPAPMERAVRIRVVAAEPDVTPVGLADPRRAKGPDGAYPHRGIDAVRVPAC